MAEQQKLIVPRATRLDEDAGRELLKITAAEDLKPAEVDRQILTWFARRVARLRRDGQALKHFLDSLQVEPA